MPYALNNSSWNRGQAKPVLLLRTSVLLAICCTFAVCEVNRPLHVLGQTRFIGQGVSTTDQPRQNNPTSSRAATLQGELVPLDPTDQKNSPERLFPIQGTAGAIGVAGTRSGQVAYRKSRPQDLQAGETGGELETLPLVPGADESENVIVQRYPDGKPRVIRHVAQDEFGNYYNHGPWEARDPTGKIVAKGSYTRGLMEGQWSRKHESGSSGLFATRPFNLFQGPFHSVAQFKNGKLDGLWTIYDQYQTKIFEIPYENGLRNGTATWFYPNHAKMREATFKQGLIDGEIIDFDEAEKVAKRRQYVDGRPIVRNTTFYRPNVKKTEEFFLGQKLEPEDVDDWWEAKPTPYLATGSEAQNGASMAWFENGQPKKRGQFKDGKPVGQFTWWHANGNKQTEGFYVDGQKNRRWTWWHENGMKQAEGIFENDRPVAVWQAWFEDGKLRKRKDYSEEPEQVPIDTPSETDENDDGEPTGQTSSVAAETIDPIPDKSNDGLGLNGPITEKLPSPTNPKSDEGEPLDLESIAPLEFRDPATPSNPPAESTNNPEEDKFGSILTDLIEINGS